ncbi:HAMP domain-containing histidine kinase [bacterium]|nr:HAMP domain-containing histidine kinase [bacterium]
MKPNFVSRFKRPIFLKLLAVVVVTGILVIILIITFFKFTMRTCFVDDIRGHVTNYMEYLINDMGNPPDISRARKIAASALLEIRYAGPDVKWTTSDQLPAINQIVKRKGPVSDKGVIMGEYRDKGFVLADRKTGRFLIVPAREIMNVPKMIMAIFFTLLIMIFLGSYWWIRKILKPISRLAEGVRQIRNNNLQHIIPLHGEKRKDELSELTDSFNAMTKQIREMLLSKEKLLLDISHELRSPLTRMKVALEFVPKGNTRESLSEDLAGMEKMIAEILETQRLSSAHGKLNLKMTNIADLIQEVAHDLKNTAPSIKPVLLTNKICLNVDAERIKIVLKNILENAIKYSELNSQPIEVSISEEDKIVEIRIQDHGRGISEADLPFVFEPFYRVDSSRSQDTGGYGLGMSLCKNIMEAHGGGISISSQPQVGTVVYLKFIKSANYPGAAGNS